MGISNDTYNRYICLIKEYLDHILDLGQRESGGKLIIANGWNRKKDELASWYFENGDKVVISDLALQQNLLRIFDGYSKLTGEAQYGETARKMIHTYFQYYQHPCGLLHWGGHRFVDFQHGNVVGMRDKKGNVHELKECFPYYDLMFETNEEATARFIRSFWNAHVYQWKTLEINRHGYYEMKGGRLWANQYEKAEPFREAAGLSFLNAASDLIYAAGELYLHNNEKGALIWMTRMLREYEKARDPVTKLGAYQFNRAKRIYEAPSDEITLSKYGDRAFRQFGSDFGDRAIEGKMLLSQQACSLYFHSTVVWTKLGKKLGVFGDNLKDFALTGLKAFAQYAYQRNDNTIIPMLTDGTSLLGYTLKKDGYYGRKGQILTAYPADERFLYAYTVVYCDIPDPILWDVIRNISIHLYAGDPGPEPVKHVISNLSDREKSDQEKSDREKSDQAKSAPMTANYNLEAVTNDSELAVLAYVTLYDHTGDEKFLQIAINIADRMIGNHYKDCLFFRSEDSNYADFDSVCPLALLQLCGAIAHKRELIPEYMTGQAYIHGQYRFEDGKVTPYTTKDMFQ